MLSRIERLNQVKQGVAIKLACGPLGWAGISYIIEKHKVLPGLATSCWQSACPWRLRGGSSGSSSSWAQWSSWRQALLREEHRRNSQLRHCPRNPRSQSDGPRPSAGSQSPQPNEKHKDNGVQMYTISRNTLQLITYFPPLEVLKCFILGNNGDSKMLCFKDPYLL